MMEPLTFSGGYDSGIASQQAQRLNELAIRSGESKERAQKAQVDEAQRYQQFQQQRQAQQAKQPQGAPQGAPQGGQQQGQSQVNPLDMMEKFVTNMGNDAAAEAEAGFKVQSDANMKKAGEMMQHLSTARKEESIAKENNIKSEIGKSDYLARQLEVVKSFDPELRPHYFEMAKKDYASKFGPIPPQIAQMPYSDKLLEALQAESLGQKEKLHAQAEASRVASENKRRDVENMATAIKNRKELADAKIAEERLADLKKNNGAYGKDAVVGNKEDKTDQMEMDMQSWNYLDKGTLPYRKAGGGGSDRNTAIIKNAAKIANDLGMTPQEVAAMPATFKANAMAYGSITKDIAALEPYKNMLDRNGDIAIDIGKKIVQSDSSLANKPLNWLQKNIGSNPDMREYLFQINTLQAEAARVIHNPRLVGQMSFEAKKEMNDVVNGEMPIADMERVIQRMKKDGGYRLEEMEKKQQSLQGTLERKKESHDEAKKPSMSSEDTKAMEWAKSNPNDPRAAKILEHNHGL